MAEGKDQRLLCLGNGSQRISQCHDRPILRNYSEVDVPRSVELAIGCEHIPTVDIGARRIADALGQYGGVVCAAILDSEVLFDVLLLRLKRKIVNYDFILDRCTPGHDILIHISTDPFYRTYWPSEY